MSTARALGLLVLLVWGVPCCVLAAFVVRHELHQARARRRARRLRPGVLVPDYRPVDRDPRAGVRLVHRDRRGGVPPVPAAARGLPAQRGRR